MARKKKLHDEEAKRTYPSPTLPDEPPVLESACITCHKKHNLKVFVIIEAKAGWMPPHYFDTFCSKACAKEWYRPVNENDVPPKIIPYKRWPDRKITNKVQ